MQWNEIKLHNSLNLHNCLRCIFRQISSTVNCCGRLPTYFMMCVPEGLLHSHLHCSPMLPVDDISVPPVVITWLCRDTISARTVVGHSLLLARLPGTHWATICVIQRLTLTVSDVHSRLLCFQSTSTLSALEVLHSMRYINLRFTYLLTCYVGFTHG